MSGTKKTSLTKTWLALCAALLFVGCLRPMEPAVLVEQTVGNLGCEADFRKSLFDNIFNNLMQGRELPTAEDLEPYLAAQLQKLPLSEAVHAEHLADIQKAYLNVYETLLRYKGKDLGVPGSYGHWLADIERGSYLSEEQSLWGQDLQRAFEELNRATAILEKDCAPVASAAPVTRPTQSSNSVYYYSVETLRQRGPEGAELLEQKAQSPYFAKGYLQTPARIYTQEQEEEPASFSSGPGNQELSEGAQEERSSAQETLAPAPSSWTALQSHLNFKMQEPEEETSSSPSPTYQPIAGEETPFVEQLFRSYHPAFAGALKTMAVLYQSCNAITLPLVDSANAPNLRGLEYVRTDRTFGKPVYRIGHIDPFVQNHYYLSQVDQSHDAGRNQCRNTQSEFPSMYSYAGMADVTVIERGSEEVGAINVFRQSSASAIELGMDCSAFVSVAYQAGGLKFGTGGQCRPYDRLGSTSTLINYENQGDKMNCLFEPQRNHPNTYAETGPVDLDTGDIFTVRDYHTVIIGQVGYHGEVPDPFRLRRIQNINECRLENFTYDKFDFDIIHSVASRSQPGTAPHTGLGVARHHARSYFPNDPVMGRHLRNYAVQACKRQFDPSTPPYRSSQMNILRHNRDNADCMCPERAILYKQSCLAGCSAP